MATVGSRFDGEDTWTITEVNGLKIGLVAYTYESPSTSSGAVSINGTAAYEYTYDNNGTLVKAIMYRKKRKNSSIPSMWMNSIPTWKKSAEI